MLTPKARDVLASLSQKTGRMAGRAGLSNEQAAADAAQGYQDQNDSSWITQPVENPTAYAGAFGTQMNARGITRAPDEVLQDSAVGLAGGFFRGAVGLASIPDGLVFGGNLGTAQMDADAAQAIENLTSQRQRIRNQTYNEIGGADARQSQREGEEIGGFLGSAHEIRANMQRTGSRIWENPDQLPQGVANAGGSLLLGGPVSKVATAGLGALGRAVGGRAGAAITANANRAGAALGMGAVEAGSVGLEAASGVMEMSHEQLMAGSDSYAAKIAEYGDTYEGRMRAKREVANDTRNMASGAMAPIALAGGALTSRLIMNPFSATTVRGALTDMGKETVEEAMQEGVGNFVGNVATRISADRNQRLAEGVGEGITEGAIYGGLSAGVTRVPATAAIRTAEAAAKGLDILAERFEEKRSSVASLAEKRETPSPEQVKATIQEAIAPTQQPQPISDRITPEMDAAELEQFGEQYQAIADTLGFDPNTFEPQNETEARLLSTFDPEGVYDLYDAMDATVQALKSNDFTAEEKSDLAVLLHDLRSSVVDGTTAAIDDIATQVNPEGSLAQDIARIQSARLAVAEYVELEEAISNNIDVSNFTPDDVADVTSEAGVRKAKQVATAAVHAPETVPVEVAEALLKHSTGAQSVVLTPRQENALKSSLSLTRTLRNLEQTAAQAGIKLPSIEVSMEVQTNPDNPDVAGPSVRGHLERVADFMSYGLMDDAQAALNDFHAFAQHMANKLRGLNQSFSGRTKGANPKVDFDAYNPATKEWFRAPVWVYSQLPTSVTTAQQIGVDASFVVDAYNDTVELYPELGLKKVEREDIHPYLIEGNAAYVAAATKRRDREGKGFAAPTQRSVNPKAPTVKSQESKPTSEKAPTKATQKVAKVEAKSENTAPKTETAQQETTPSRNETEQDVAQSQTSEVTGYYTPEGVAKLSDTGLNSRIEEIQDRAALNESRPTDAKNLKVLLADRTRREEANASNITEPAAEVASEAGAEAQAEGDTAQEAAVAVPTVQETFPNLIIGKGGANILYDGMTMDNEGRTRLAGPDAMTAAEVVATLNEDTRLAEELGKPIQLAPRVRMAYVSVIGAVADKITNAIVTRMKANKLLGPIMAGKVAEPLLLLVDNRLANILSRNEDGTYSLNERMLETAQLAFSDWVAQNTVAPKPISAEKLAKRLGVRETEITDSMLKANNTSIQMATARQQIADRIRSFAGLKEKSDAYMGQVEGLFDSIAGEFLEAAIETGHLTRTDVKFLVEEPNGTMAPRERAFVSVNRDAFGVPFSNDADAPAFMGQTTLLSEVITKRAERKGYSLMQPEGKKSKTQMKTIAELTEVNQEVQLRENAVSHKVNVPFVTVLRALSRDGAVEVFGAGSTEGKRMNVNDRDSKDGKNLSIISAYDSLFGTVEEMDRRAAAEGIDPKDVTLYREYEFTQVARLQQQGAHGDQASKLVRDAITPYAATLDLSGNNPEHWEMWHRGLGQALGLKIERMGTDEIFTGVANKLANDAVMEAAAAMYAVVVDNDTSVDLVQPLLNAGLTTPTQVHALLSKVLYDAAVASGQDLTNFETHMYVEADGVTDGPTNSLIYMRVGGFDEKFVASLRRGGGTFSKRPTPLHEIFAPIDGSPVPDTYQHVANNVGDAQAQKLKVMKDNADKPNEIDQVAKATDVVLRRLLGDKGYTYTVNEETGEINVTIGRNQLKNPVTVTVYGSSVGGIADKIARELATQLYSRITDAMQLADTHGVNWTEVLFADAVEVTMAAEGEALSTSRDLTDEFNRALNTIANFRLVSFTERGTDNIRYAVSRKKADKIIDFGKANPEKLTLSAGHLANISENIAKLYAGPMAQAINDELGTAVQGSSVIQKATNTMSVLARSAFVSLVQHELAQDDASQANGLTYAKMKEIMRKVGWLLPYMEGDDIEVLVKGLSFGDLPGTERSTYSATSRGKIEGAMKVRLPAIAGVAGAAFVNISYGDGRMIIKASPNIQGGRLMVFDGIHLALDKARQNGKAINEAVLEAWQTGTPFADLQRAFQKIVDSFDPSTLDFDQQEYVVNTLRLDSEIAPVDSIQRGMNYMNTTLQEYALQEAARQAVLRKVHLSSDHMAALNAPASTEADADRIDLEGKTVEETAKILNDMYLVELERLRKERGAVVKYAEAGSVSPIMQGFKEHKTGVRIAGSFGLRQALEGAKMKPEHRALARRALNGLKGQSWKIVYGTAKQINDYIAEKGLRGSIEQGDLGFSDAKNQTVYLATDNSETLVHELVHAATYTNMAAYYADPSSVTPEVADAIKRLEILMDEWLNTVDDAAMLQLNSRRKSIQDAKAAIQAHANNPAAALNEFVAWNLSNTGLQEVNKTMRTRLAKIARDVRDALRKMFKLPPVNNDMFTNIRFNAMILMSEKPPVTEAADAILNHRTNTDRTDLSDVRAGFSRMMKAAEGKWGKMKIPPSQLALRFGYRLSDKAVVAGFPMTQEERRAFIMVASAYRMNAVSNPTANMKLERQYTEVLAQLSQANMMTDPNSTDPNDQLIASARMDLLSGRVDTGVDVAGRSMLLPMFVALGATNSTAQKLFANITVRDRKGINKGNTFDKLAAAHATDAMNKAVDLSLNIKAGSPVASEIFGTINEMLEESNREQSRVAEILAQPGHLINFLNDKATDMNAVALDKAHDLLESVVKATQGTKLETAGTLAVRAAQAGMSLFNKNKVAEGAVLADIALNQSEMYQPLRSFFAEIMGQNDNNTDILSLTKIVRAVIHRVRQAYRKQLPAEIARKFSRPLDSTEWEALHTVFGGMDAASVLDAGVTTTQFIDALNDAGAMQRLLDAKRANIRRAFAGSYQDVMTDVARLADVISGGVVADGMVKRNALAIANRVGSPTVGNYTRNDEVVRDLDALITLMAMNQIPSGGNVRQATYLQRIQKVKKLAQSEPNGLSYTLSMIATSRATEMARVPDHLKYNVQKGYMPSESLGQVKLVKTSQIEKMSKLGWRLVDDRKAGPAERLHDGKSQGYVYMATDMSEATFKQGILQTVRATSFGRDRVTGRSFAAPSAGWITEARAVERIRKAIERSGTDEGLVPIYNADGNLVAFERAINQDIAESAIEVQRNAAVSIGLWLGRQHEEVEAAALNSVLIDRLVADYNRGKPDEYFDLIEEGEKNPVIADALSLIPESDMQSIRDAMGGKFLVRKSLYENVLGYRNMSIGDLWTGNTTLPKETREAIAAGMMTVLGDKAYTHLVRAEKVWENLMGDARVAIVVKSMIVPAVNAVSGFLQLMANGISPVHAARSLGEKMREAHIYSQNEQKLQELMIARAEAIGSNRKDRQQLIETQMQKIEDANRRLTIWPLIEAGHFGLVTEGLTEDDMALTQGRFWDYFSKQAEKLPPAVQTAGRYALVTKDTALFQGLAKAVSMTDFLGKAVLYDHLTQKQRLSPKQALVRVNAEFGDFDYIAGRGRAKAEAMGGVWFWAFKLRTMKVAAALIRNNPLHVFLTTMLPGYDWAGSVVDDNMAALLWDGRWDNSIGVDNALRGAYLNPVYQVVG